MKKLFVLSLCFCMGLSACEDTIPSPVELSLNFSNLEVGQKAAYQRYTSTCAGFERDFKLTGDILIVEVIEEDGQLMLQETFTPESPMYQTNPSPLTHPITSDGEKIIIPNRWGSQLFFFYGNDSLFLNPQHNAALKQDRCVMMQDGTPFIGNEIGKIDKFEIGSLEQKDKTAVSCVPGSMFGNLEAYLIYDEKRILMSHTMQDGDQISGWSLLED